MLYARIDNETGKRQTLNDHLYNVSNLFSYSGADIGISATKKIIAYLHDMGKASSVWQKKLELNIHGYPHAYAGALWIYRKYGTDGKRFCQLTAEIIAMSVWSHHGGLRDCAGTDCNLYYPEKISIADGGEDEYIQCINAFFTECIKEVELDVLFAEACLEIKIISDKIYKRFNEPKLSNEDYSNVCFFALGLLERFLFSSLIDADRYDAAFTPKDISIPKNPIKWSELGLNLENHLNSINTEDSSSEIYNLRKSIADQCLAFAEKESGIYRLNVPTGGGKTFSALRYALRFAEINKCNHIFYIAPYLTIIEQNAEDCRNALSCTTDILLEHHSNIITEPDKSDEEAPMNHLKLMTERWDAPIIFTTLVQFLNTLFSGETQSARRMNSLHNSIIIFDEVQNIPVRLVYMFNSAMRFLNYICGCTIVLCTATQPTLEKVQYPITLSEPSDIFTGYKTAFLAFRRTCVKDCTDAFMTDQETAEFAKSLPDDLSSVLIIVNTKKTALSVFEIIKKSSKKAYYLSTCMCAAHRKTIIDEIKKNLINKERIVCVSTQLIEAGVNISFDCVIRSLAGLDSIAQAAGRCNRHGKGPLREVYIIRCSDEKVEKLDDIAIGQRATVRILREFKSNPTRFDGDLLSPTAIEKYYGYYYEERRGCMNYPVKIKGSNLNTSLFDLLGSNNTVVREIEANIKGRTGHTSNLPPHLLYQSFKTAGQEFCVIKDNTTGVIVPYGDGKTIISDLYSGISVTEKIKILKKAQRYTLNIYRGNLLKLMDVHAIDKIKDLDIFVLDSSYYSDETGAASGTKVNLVDCIM